MAVMASIRSYITIVESTGAGTPTEAFLDALWATTAPHPFMRGQRIYDDKAVVEVRPDVDNRDRQVHIKDIMALEAGERRGQGRDALVFLLKLADEHGVTLTLHPKAYAKGPGSERFPKTPALKAWYAHYGFKPKRGEMIRQPGTPIPAPRSAPDEKPA